MAFKSTHLFFALTLLLLGCPAPENTPDASLNDAAPSPLQDTDGDTITDVDEAERDARDTDMDGTPDFMDDDSDGDGLADSLEAGDSDPSTPPVDSDSDGIPDYIDVDSDDNGIEDGVEGVGDTDGDRRPDYVDLDDDNDGLPDVIEIGDDPENPVDSDMDGVPNYRDEDSDNDFIPDSFERDTDTDMDEIIDMLDQDSDGDGIPDADEAGDMDLMTPPIDTDMDGTPDFRDTDSDNDGLSDASEAMSGTSPTNADSDMDGVSDLVEIGAETDPLDAMDSPRTRGDFVFVVPFMQAADPALDTLRFRTSIAFADIYFLFDISGSMRSEITALRDAVGTIATNLQCADSGTACMRDTDCAAGNICSPFTTTCVEDPGMSSCVLSPYTGTGFYEDYYENRLSLQPDPAMTRDRIRLETFGGTEELYEGIVGVATAGGTSPAPAGCADLAAMPGRLGCPGYREEAVRILVAFTDEDSDGGVTLAQASAALRDTGITFIGIWSGSPGSAARNDMVNVARESGSLDRAGAPLVFDGRDSAVVTPVTNAINEIVAGVPLRVTIAQEDDPSDAIDATQFIDFLETNTMAMGCSDSMTEDTDMDMRPDAYPAVTPGTPVCWDVVPAMNTMVEPTADPQVYRATLTVSGDGSPLDQRTVIFLIPPTVAPPGMID
jgi:hypothetical protein